MAGIKSWLNWHTESVVEVDQSKATNIGVAVAPPEAPDYVWLVETSKGVFEDVTAKWLDIRHGVLVFRGGRQWDSILVAYNPTAWITVCLDEE